MLREFLLLAVFYTLELLKAHNNVMTLKKYNILNDKVNLINASISNLYKNINSTNNFK